jgi:hypothetical protein
LTCGLCTAQAASSRDLVQGAEPVATKTQGQGVRGRRHWPSVARSALRICQPKRRACSSRIRRHTKSEFEHRPSIPAIALILPIHAIDRGGVETSTRDRIRLSHRRALAALNRRSRSAAMAYELPVGHRPSDRLMQRSFNRRQPNKRSGRIA